MNQLPSAEFRKQYAALTEVTQVTTNGHVIGTWLPGSPRPVAQIRNDGLIDTDPWRTEFSGKLQAELEKAGITFSGAAWRPEPTTPAAFVLDIPLAPVPEWSGPRQKPCRCVACARSGPDGCYGTDALREQAEQLCATEGCKCWGGADRECSGCYIDGK